MNAPSVSFCPYSFRRFALILIRMNGGAGPAGPLLGDDQGDLQAAFDGVAQPTHWQAGGGLGRLRSARPPNNGRRWRRGLLQGRVAAELVLRRDRPLQKNMQSLGAQVRAPLVIESEPLAGGG